MSSSDQDWNKKYDASLVDEDVRLRARGYRPWGGITPSILARITAGFLAALLWALTAKDPLVPAVLAVVLGAVILVGFLSVLRTKAVSRH